MRVALCGAVSVTGPSAEVRLTRVQPQVGLALFVLERHRPVAREELAHVLWGDELSPHWPGAARGVITRIRDAFDEAGLPRTALTTSGGLVHLHLPPEVEVDVEAARRAVDEAGAALRADRPAEAAEWAERAAADLAGGFLPGVDSAWVDGRRREVEGLQRRAERLRADGLLASGQAGRAVAPARALVEADPYDEDVHRLLVAALTAAGDRLGALAALDACRELFHRELGVGLAPETLALHDALSGAGRSAPDPADARGVAGGGVPAVPRRPATPGGAFVGRGPEQDLLVEEVLRPPRRQLAPGLRVVVVEGEAGVGKTRLAHEVADTVEPAGVRVLWGRCGPDTGLPYEPVVEALATIVASERLGTIDLDDVRADLAALIPGLRTGGAVGASAVPELDRTRLFRAATLAFERFATGPVVWVVDDLQWASADTLALIGHLGAGLVDAPLTILATTRERPAPVAATLAHLARQVPLRVLPLVGLAVGEVERWLADAAIRPASGLAEDVHLRTGGNPLYLGHLLRAAADAGGTLDPTRVPAELQAFLDQRIAAQPPDAGLVLAVAAVAGTTIGLDALRAATGLDDRALLAAVDALAATRLLLEDADGGGVRFTHALVRDAVDAGTGPSRRAWFHLRLAEHLEGFDGPGGAAEVARHFSAAGPAAADRARRWSLAAAEEALETAAWATAEEHLERARARPGLDVDDRIRALVAEGRLRRAGGDRTRTFAVLDEAIALARVHARPRRLAQAVLALVGGGGRGVPDHARHRWLSPIEEALAALGPDDDDLRVPLLGAFALALLLTGRDAERRAAADEALRLARLHGDPIVVAQALLDHRQARVEPEHAEARLADLDEVLAITEGSARLGLAVAASMYQHEDRLLVGDRDGARASLARAEALLVEHPDPYWAWCAATWRALGLLLDGDAAGAEAAALAALVSAVPASAAPGEEPEAGVEAVACYGVNLVAVRLHQGRAGEVVDLLTVAADANPQIPCYRAVLALCLAEDGQAGRARAEVEALAVDGFGGIPHDTNRLLAFTVLADVAGQLGLAELAPALLAELAPHAGRHVLLNCFGGGGAAWGPVSAQLAGLARLVGDGAAADGWAADAWASAAAMGSTFVVARSPGARLSAPPV